MIGSLTTLKIRSFYIFKIPNMSYAIFHVSFLQYNEFVLQDLLPVQKTVKFQSDK